MNFKTILFSGLLITSVIFGQGVQDVNGYYANSGLQTSSARTVIQTISWNGNERVLDIGCGDGKVTNWIAENFTENMVIGIDISETMIQFASSHYLAQNLNFFQADAAMLPFDRQFEIVVSFSTLHWVLDQEAGLKSIFKALVPGGRAQILTYGKHPMNLSRLAERLIYSEKWAAYFPEYIPQRVYYSPEEYTILLNKAGFIQINLITETSQTIYSDRAALTAFVKPLLNFIYHLPEDLREQFIDEVVDQIIDLSMPTVDGSIIFEVLNLNASFQRPTGI
jgi:trans-aconitate 2-methyltransferase